MLALVFACPNGLGPSHTSRGDIINPGGDHIDKRSQDQKPEHQVDAPFWKIPKGGNNAGGFKDDKSSTCVDGQ